ncbi:hypothetical protein [Halomarina oriensis]|uniref:Uncharacterized protein n=1 Tax=Halomarina oriensis TaxID=671145 RepID=A0A6B0GNU9_9EURY|nr:hypothetical protein [Halomarina oriensis]MWG36464.1 hypothetical protein [Halomarina oriensis]
MVFDNCTATTEDHVSYDPERYDPDAHPDECLTCGALLDGTGDGATTSRSCPQCDVTVVVI